ncbi:MAG: hypothetical protein ABI624_24415, partial [Casimicrobiaceae bacterium]
MKTRYLTNGVLVGGGACCLAILFYWLATSGSAVLTAGVPFILLTLLALGFFVALRLSTVLQATIVALGIASIGLLYATEVAIYRENAGYGISTVPYFGIEHMPERHRQQVIALAQESGRPIDERTRVQVLDASRAKGLHSVAAVMIGEVIDQRGPGAVLASRAGMSVAHAAHVNPHAAQDQSQSSELMPLGGISSTPTVLCNQQGQYVTYQSDERGFRNPEGTWNAPQADMAALGQSFVQGYCVPDGKGFVDLLRSRYPTTLNMGMSGDG